MTKREKIIYPIFLVLIILLMSFYFYKTRGEQNSKLLVPTREEILKEGYPTNQAGETYGPAIENMFPPDLMLATGEDNVRGYIKLSQSAGKVAESPEEAVELNRSTKAYTIPLYLQDGETIIGKFVLANTRSGG